jgi:hypothetical protein
VLGVRVGLSGLVFFTGSYYLVSGCWPLATFPAGRLLNEKKAKVWTEIADIINENKFDTYPELS